MTAKHKLIRKYHKHEEIEVDSKSLFDFKNGNRTTIDHIVEFENQKVVVTLAPPVTPYPHYKALYGNVEMYAGK